MIIAFLIISAILGLMLIPFGWLANKWNGAIISLIIAIVISGLLTFDSWIKIIDWNNGICTECGGEYKFQGASKSHSGAETLYYTYENCDHLIKQ